MDADSAGLIVKIIAIIGYISGLLTFLSGALVLFAGYLIIAFIEKIFGPIGALASGGIYLVGVMLIILGAWTFYANYELSKYKNWARINAIITAVVVIIEGVFGMPFSIIGMILELAILYFLGFNKGVKALFKS